jgi:hypothetical protein
MGWNAFDELETVIQKSIKPLAKVRNCKHPEQYTCK